MNSEPPENQERIHEMLQDLLVSEGEVLTSWGIVFEAQAPTSLTPYFGYWHGPKGTPPWRSRGLYSQAIAFMDAESIHQEFHKCDDELEDNDADGQES